MTKKNTVLTLDQLIARKVQKDKNAIGFKDIYVKSLDGCLKFEKPTDDDVLQCMTDMGDNEKDIKRIYEAYKTLEYNCCPSLKNPKLQEAYEVKDFYSIVNKLFEVAEVLAIGSELISMSGMNDVEIKNA